MEWEFQNDRPIYSQIIEQIQLRIVSGIYPAGSKLMSVRDLAAEAGVNPNTMQRALSDLERDRLVFSQRTAGRFITEDQAMIEEVKGGLAKQQIENFLSNMARIGYDKKAVIAMIAKEEGEKK